MSVTVRPSVTVCGVASEEFTIPCFKVQGRLDLPAAILCVPLVDYVLEWRKLVFAVVGVNVVVHCNEPHVMLWKENLGVVAGFEVLPSKSGKVFYNDRPYLAALNIINHAAEIGSVKVCPAVTVVNIEFCYSKAIVPRILRKHSFLGLYAHTVTAEIIIAVEPTIKRCNPVLLYVHNNRPFFQQTESEYLHFYYTLFLQKIQDIKA